MTYNEYATNISPLGAKIAEAYFKEMGSNAFPIDPEMIASKFFGLHIEPKHQLGAMGVLSGIDATQSTLFVDADIYLSDETQHIARQAIAHEVGHIIYDSSRLRSLSPRTIDEAYTAHLTMRKESRLETRANMFSGALLVPRPYLIQEAFGLLLSNIEDLKEANPSMLVGRLMSALCGAKLANHFGTSNEVISWRIRNEQLLALLQVGEFDPITWIDERAIRSVLELPEPPVTLAESVMGLLPASLRLKLFEV